MKTFKIITMLCALLFVPLAHATPATDNLLANYQSQGAGAPNAAKAAQDWTREVVVDGEKMSCSTCHGTDLKQAGKHHVTGKVINPMSRQANAERFTNEKKIRKWFKRNCNDAWGRDCTAQEKTDFLTFLLAQ